MAVPLLDRLIYSSRLRDAIRKLKSANDFRPEGLSRLHRQLRWSAGLTGVLPTTMYLILGSIENHAHRAVDGALWGVGIGLLVFLGFRHYTPSAEILPYSTGKVTEGAILYARYWPMFVRYWPLPLRAYGWEIKYEANDEIFDGGQWVQHKPKIQKWMVEGAELGKGDPIVVFADFSKPTKNIPLFLGLFRDTCISQSRYQEFANRPFLQELDRGDF